MKFSKKIIALMLAVLLVATLFAACGKKEDNNKDGNTAPSNQTNGTLTVGFDQEFPPMGFVADDGSYIGFDLDLAAEVAKRLNMEIKLQPIDWDNKDNELATGNIDCIWNGFTMSDERVDKYEWTTPYMNNNQIVVVRNDSDMETFADLAGKTIMVQKDSSAMEALNKSELKDSVGKVLETGTNLNALLELTQGTVDAVVMDECVARYNVENGNVDYKVLEEVVGAEKFGVGFLLGNTDLRDKVESTLLEMVADGKMAEISNKWFGRDITTLGK